MLIIHEKVGIIANLSIIYVSYSCYKSTPASSILVMNLAIVDLIVVLQLINHGNQTHKCRAGQGMILLNMFSNGRDVNERNG